MCGCDWGCVCELTPLNDLLLLLLLHTYHQEYLYTALAKRRGKKNTEGERASETRRVSRFLVFREHRIDVLKGFVDLFPDFGTGEHDLARHEDEQHDLGLHHTVDETRKELRLILPREI